MNVTEAVDLLVRYTDNITASDGRYGARADRALIMLQRVYENVWNKRGWRFKIITLDALVQPADDVFNLPVDFAELGEAGGLWMRASGSTGKWTPVEEWSAEEQIAALATANESGGIPEYFAIYGTQVHFLPVSAEFEYRFVYYKVAKQLVYGATPDADTFEVPLAYHNTVLIAGGIARLQRGKADVREDWTADYNEGLAQMVERERPISSEAQFLPDQVPPMD